ncbi:MAG: hypothetical protein N2490_01105 [Ignavibacteria bacterium]|nr:hypothetical protein [Ignavibacteria bacterium]
MKNTKAKESREKENLIKRYCRHLKMGYSMYSFPEEESSQVEEYAKELDEKNMNDSFTKLIQRSKREGMQLWEKMCIEGLRGEKVKLNGSVWIFVMRSRFGINEKMQKVRNKDEVIKVNLDFENIDKEKND